MISLREMLSRGQTALGLAHSYNAPGIIERIGSAWDWIWIDVQHGQFGYEGALTAVRAVETVGSRAVVRSPGHSREWLGLLADMAPAGMMVPMVNDRQEAQAIVESLRFAPLGKRSFGARRAGDREGLQYYHSLDLFVIAQIETPEGIANASAIIETEGVDCLFFGADDMKLHFGLPVETPALESPMLLEAMQRTAEAARRVGKFAGCVAVGQEAARMAAGMGYQLLACGADQAFLRDGSAAALRAARAGLETAEAIRKDGIKRAVALAPTPVAPTSFEAQGGRDDGH